MERKIITIGYEIPGHSDDYVAFGSGQSLMEADIVLISPDSFEPNGHWISFTSTDGGCYNVETSRVYKQRISHLKKEVVDLLNAGKTVFVFLTKKEEYSLAHSASTEKKGQTMYSTETYNNYYFLPISIGNLTSASGKHIEFTKNPIFADFYKIFGKDLKYELYSEKPENARVIFTGKDKNKILGAYFKMGAGNLVVLPYVDYDRNKFTKGVKGKDGKKQLHWTAPAIKFGNMLVAKFIQIDRDLSQDSVKTPPPEWSLAKEFSTSKEIRLQDSIIAENEKISKIKEQIQSLEKELVEEQILKDLLYEKGKALENAVNTALKILGYKSENFNDGNLEIDHVITSPEGKRFIGECEGKDSSAISIDKFRQLAENIQTDLQRDEVEDPAIGILFGNGFRLIKPEERTEQFTTKCLNSAKRGTILIRTVDLYLVAKYLKENTDEKYAKSCREAILASVGSIVKFPPKT